MPQVRTEVASLYHNTKLTRVNTFVEVQGPANQTWIMLITRLYKLRNGEWRVSGPWLYRREDGMEEHVQEENELVLSNHVNSNPLSVVGEGDLSLIHI